jgi:hypothetical protein
VLRAQSATFEAGARREASRSDSLLRGERRVIDGAAQALRPKGVIGNCDGRMPAGGTQRGWCRRKASTNRLHAPPNVRAERPAEAACLARESENTGRRFPGQGALPRRVRSRAKG